MKDLHSFHCFTFFLWLWERDGEGRRERKNTQINLCCQEIKQLDKQSIFKCSALGFCVYFSRTREGGCASQEDLREQGIKNCLNKPRTLQRILQVLCGPQT